MITNQQVYDALNHCIEKRWNRLANGSSWLGVPPCALCVLFKGDNENNNAPMENCHACPIYIHNNGLGCGKGSTFASWVKSMSIDNACAMLDELIAIKQHYFGDLE